MTADLRCIRFADWRPTPPELLFCTGGRAVNRRTRLDRQSSSALTATLPGGRERVGVGEPEAPSVETVQVWVAPLDVAPTVLASLAATLSPAERVRAGRFCFPVDARRFIAAHGWLRNVLGDTLGIAPAQLALTDGPGKPRLADDEAGLRFNLSRSAGLALVAVAPHDV